MYVFGHSRPGDSVSTSSSRPAQAQMELKAAQELLAVSKLGGMQFTNCNFGTVHCTEKTLNHDHSWQEDHRHCMF